MTQLSRIRLLHAILTEPGQRLRELAAQVDIHENTAREHLAVLEAEGLIASRRLATGTRGRPPVVYEPAQPDEPNPVADARIAQAISLGAAIRLLDPTFDRSEEIGRDGQRQLDALFGHLEDAGLEPVLGGEALSLDLRPCRYHGMLRAERVAVCHVHERLIASLLRRSGGPLEVDSFEPFNTPDRCRLSLTVTDRAEGSAGHLAAARCDPADPAHQAGQAESPGRLRATGRGTARPSRPA